MTRPTHRRARAAATVALVTALATAGCSSGGDGGSGGNGASGGNGGDGGSPATESALVTWAGDVCGHLQAGGRQLSMPSSGADDPQSARENAVTFLDGLSQQLGTLAENLEREGPPPAEGGEDAYADALRTLEETRESVRTALTTLEGAEVDDAATLQRAFTQAGEDMSAAAAYEGPAEELKQSPELNAAFEESPACRNLDGGPASAPPAP
ncbi:MULTISPECIES: hypothetical protein [Streptomyces]|uniref:hypothetical protein n=1 Tax=Streptomyces TaxID=1883 RepID=UPI0022489840|nr:hypothetical protein [Streptomyces sp. JHD 1]MCX2968342.1 hypothetical protein [Streptomyces sp. JHD 1]